MKTLLFTLTALTTAYASLSLAMESSAKISESTAKEVEIEMEADKDLIIRNAKPDARIYLLSDGKIMTPNMAKAFEVLQSDASNAGKSGYELAIEVFNKK